MTKKRSFSTWTWREYALQLSVVIIGVFVTFVGSDLVSRWSRVRQAKTMMQLVAEELSVNRQQLVQMCDKLRYDHRGVLMFQHYRMDVDKIPTDSLEKYMHIIGSIQGLTLQTDALEVLKASGLIPAIGDKQLLMELMGSYKMLSDLDANIRFYNKRKEDAMNHLFANSSALDFNSDDVRVSWRAMMDNPMCRAFMATAAYSFGDEGSFDASIAGMDETIASIKKKYGFK